MPALRHLLEALLNPFFLCWLALVILALAVQSPRWVRRALLGLALLWFLLSTGFFPQWLTRHLEGQYPWVEQVDQRIPYVVVLSGGQASQPLYPANTLLYGASLKRLVEGLRLLHQLPKAKLILSGGGYGGEVAESSHLADVVRYLGVDSQRLILEVDSVNTADQARELKAQLQGKAFYLVTSAIHMPRAMALFKAQGLDPIPAPTDFTLYWQDERWQKTWLPNASNMMYLSIALHELLGMLWSQSFHGS